VYGKWDDWECAGIKGGRGEWQKTMCILSLALDINTTSNNTNNTNRNTSKIMHRLVPETHLDGICLLTMVNMLNRLVNILIGLRLTLGWLTGRTPESSAARCKQEKADTDDQEPD
tara:strand:- start:4114 stop:4458 length:345 start_codon:yes stop_codon:yes gene_type:complete